MTLIHIFIDLYSVFSSKTNKMFKLNSILTFVCVTFFSVFSLAQPLTNGMGIITHWTGFSGEWDAFSIYETENNASATHNSSVAVFNKNISIHQRLSTVIVKQNSFQ